MKLKKSFSAKVILLFSIMIFSSCTSAKLSVPVPGQGSAKIRNIYVEYYNLGESYYKLEDYSKAAEYYELAMRKKEQYWASYYKLAKCYVFNSDWNSALPMYKKILSRDPENSSLKASVAYIYSMQGNFKLSKKIYEELLSVNPKNSDYIENYLAVLLSNEKSFKKNSESFTQYFDVLKTEFPDNKNIRIFEEKYNTLMEIDLEETDSDTEETEDSDSSDDESIGESAP